MATKPSSLVDIFEKNKYNLDDVSRKSRAWFEQQVLLLNRKRLTPNKILQSDPQQLRAQVFPGFLYMFVYDPKFKESSPFRRVEANDWATAMMLPVERFQGATKEQVWTESRRKAR
jgi:Fe-S cluster biosynthesis and repair protein YggX